MSLLFFVIIIITVLFYFFMPFVIAILAPGFVKNKETYELAIHFGKIIFPYLLFIALVAQFSSITNTYNRFAFGAFAPAILNISFIGSLIFFTPYVLSPGHALSYGVLIGGVMQFLLMYYAIYKLQITPILVLPKIDDNVKKFLKLLLPGMLGAGAIQINIIVGTIIASFLPTGAISHLYYADRINQFPLALFGIALGIALLPTLSNYIKQGANEEKINNIQNRSLEFSLLISLPSAAGLFILSEPIIRILFERGSFSNVDTYYSSQVLSLFALGLPAYILIKVLNPSFFAREDTKTPLYITLICVVLNVILSLLLISSIREMGIALATAISSWANVLILYILLKNKWNLSLDMRLKTNFIKILIATIITFFGILLFRNIFLTGITDSNTLINALLLLLNILFALIIFASMVFVLKIYSKGEIKENLKI